MSKLLALILLLCTVSVASADTHPLGYRWHKNPPFTLTVRDGTSNPDWAPLIVQAAAQWSQSDVVNLNVQRGNYCGKKGGGHGSITICDADFGATTAAWAQYDTRQVYINSASINLNNYYDASWDLSELNGLHPRLGILCHELGHTLGLDHADYGDPTCMDGQIDIYYYPAPQDFELLRQIYP